MSSGWFWTQNVHKTFASGLFDYLPYHLHHQQQSCFFFSKLYQVIFSPHHASLSMLSSLSRQLFQWFIGNPESENQFQQPYHLDLFHRICTPTLRCWASDAASENIRFTRIASLVAELWDLTLFCYFGHVTKIGQS